MSMGDGHADYSIVEADMRREFGVVRKAMIHGSIEPVELEEALTALMDIQVRTLGLLPRVGDGKFLTIAAARPWFGIIGALGLVAAGAYANYLFGKIG